MADKHIKRGHRPIHPGEILREDTMPALGMNVTQFAAALGVTRKTMSALIHEKQGVSLAMATRLSAALGNSTGFWIGMQTEYDLWHVDPPTDVKPIKWRDAAAPVA
jgi:addiction module HigA family antidote